MLWAQGCLYLGPITYDPDVNMPPEIRWTSNGTCVDRGDSGLDANDGVGVICMDQAPSAWICAVDPDGDELAFMWTSSTTVLDELAFYWNDGCGYVSEGSADGLPPGEIVTCTVSEKLAEGERVGSAAKVTYRWEVVY